MPALDHTGLLFGGVVVGINVLGFLSLRGCLFSILQGFLFAFGCDRPGVGPDSDFGCGFQGPDQCEYLVDLLGAGTKVAAQVRSEADVQG